VLDVLAVGLEGDRPLRLAMGTGSLIALLLGTWIGCAAPPRHSLREASSNWAALPDASWALPAARCLVAVTCGSVGAVLCVLYTNVFTKHVDLAPIGLAVCGGAVTALLASAWAGLLAPRLGALPAVAVVLASAAVLSLEGAPVVLGFLIPTVHVCAPLSPWAALAALCASTGVLALTPRGFRTDGGADPAP
jgi:hypothetical protein